MVGSPASTGALPPQRFDRRGHLGVLPYAVVIAAVSTACGGTSTGSKAGPGSTNPPSAVAGGPATAAALARTQAACRQTTWKAKLRLTIDMAGQNAALDADLLADPRPGHVTGRLTASNGLQEEIVDDVDYLRQGDTKWSKVDVSALPADQQRPPCAEFAALAGPGITDVQELSDQSGGSAHHYRFRGDAYTLLAASLLYSPQPLAPFKATRVQVSADLYTDASGRPLSYQTDTANDSDADGGIVSMTLIETYSDFGGTVDVKAPDPSQVTDQLPPGLQVQAPPDPSA